MFHSFPCYTLLLCVPSSSCCIGKAPEEAEPFAKKAKMEALGPQAFLQSGMASSYSTPTPTVPPIAGPSFIPPTTFPQPQKPAATPVAPLFPSAATTTPKVCVCVCVCVCTCVQLQYMCVFIRSL